MRNINLSFYVKYLFIYIVGPITLVGFQNCSNMSADPNQLSLKADSQLDSGSSTTITQPVVVVTSGTTTASNTTVVVPPASAPVSSVTSKIVFPPDSATTDSSILVRGSSQAPSGKTIQSVTVNGVIATSSDGYLNWKASVPLSVGVNAVTVNVVASGQNYSNQASVNIERFSSEAALTRGSGYWSGRLMGMTYEPTQNRFIFSDDIEDGVFEVKLSNGVRKMLSDSEGGDNVGTGFEISQPIAVAAQGNTSYTVDGNYLVKIDLVSGNRSVLTQQATMSSIYFSPNKTELYAIQYDLENIIKINLSTGQSTVAVAKSFSGSPDLRSPKIMAVSSAKNKAYVNLYYQDSLLAVDLNTGARSVWSARQGSEPLLSDPVAMAVNDSSNQAFVWDSGHLVAIDLTTGRRKLFSTSGPFSQYKDIAAMTDTPWGLAIVDFVPSYMPTPRSPTVILIDPLEGTRVIISR